MCTCFCITQAPEKSKVWVTRKIVRICLFTLNRWLQRKNIVRVNLKVQTFINMVSKIRFCRCGRSLKIGFSSNTTWLQRCRGWSWNRQRWWQWWWKSCCGESGPRRRWKRPHSCWWILRWLGNCSWHRRRSHLLELSNKWMNLSHLRWICDLLK
jgi:hypothetical protein